MFDKVVITSGPTREPIDPVRYISNRSSGKSGFYLAGEAWKRGIREIIYISGPSSFIPRDVSVISIESALQMREQLQLHAAGSDVVIMAAAVGDYRVERYSTKKIKKSEDTMLLHLVRNPDLLTELGRAKRPGQILVGYAAETDNILVHARGKLERKNLDLLVLNQVSGENPAFDVDENQVYLITRDDTQKLPKLSKAELAARIWDEIYRIKKTM